MKNSSACPKSLGIFFAVITIFIWGITFVSTKYLLKNFSAFEILFVRFILAYLGLWIIKPVSLKLENKKDNVWFFLAGLSGIIIYQFTENAAISFTTASNVSIIVSICPMFTAIIAQIFFKEKHITIFFVVGFIIAISGIVLVSLNGASGLHFNPKGDLLALASAVCWGFYSMAVSKINSMNLDRILCTRRMFFYAVITMIPFAVFGIFENDPSSSFYLNMDAQKNAERFSSLVSWANFCFLGLGASAFCFVVWNVACKTLGTVKVTVGIYMIPVVTIIFAFFILGEKLTVLGAVGCVLTIAGLAISNRGNK
ncbi:DMT family transporter [Treponema sp.]|uniref:DMT family transporter n=1 Tax=Treponema sp. TaxID=166 RepID=UPI00298E1041|nr:DMT family transporter [Treponema sp.]MCQ2241758.1 DMT family transporter [Treponema sp.]